MQKAEAAADTATMTQLAAKEQASRDAFYMPDGLLQQSAYHTIDRVFTSFPEYHRTAIKNAFFGC